ncbi:MAG: PPC domain-containing protein [Candidatus Solibacter usitatus]|nr:PPC domain-containing protein [Candidatus Solibacter usitatus]
MRTAIGLLLAATAFAEPQHMIEYALPRGGSQGTSVEVTLSGRFLNEPREIVYYGRGIRATQIRSGAKAAEEVKARFEIAADCPPGEHVFRLRTATALTDAITFWVSPFPAVSELEKKAGENDTREKAQAVPLNSTVEGQINTGDKADRDLYSFMAKKGQRISAELESARLGTQHQGNGENDLGMRILDSAGKELAKGDDSALFVQDPVLSVLAPADGTYYVEVAQQVYVLPRLAWYRVHIGDFSRPMALFPSGGQLGEKLQLRVLGDPAGERTEMAELPNRVGNLDYFAGTAGEQPPSPNVLRVSSYPNVLKAEGADPTSVPALPAALNGIYETAGAPHVFRFSAKKNENWVVRVYARTLGSPMDPKIWIRAVNGKSNILSADDARLADRGFVSMRGTWHIKDQLDPVALFKTPADGEYLLGIEDTRGMASPLHVYRVEMEPARNTVYTHITSSDAYQMPRTVGMIIPQGSRWNLNVQIAPGFGNEYKGDIELEAVGLPRGVQMVAGRYSKGATRMPVQFIAAGNAEQQAVPVELRAKAADGPPLLSGSRQAFGLFNRPGEHPWHFVFLEKYILAVTQPAPFHLEVDQPRIPLAKSGELSLKTRIVRHDGYNGPVDLTADWLPSGVSSGGSITVPAGKTEASFRIQAGEKIPAGISQFSLSATTSDAGDAYSGIGRIRVSSPFLKLEVAEPYVTIDLKRASVERGQRGELIAELKQNRAFEGKAEVILKRLPKGVKMAVPVATFSSRDREIVIPVEASEDALVGMYKDITCEVSIKDKGETIKQNTGSGQLRIDPARHTRASR